MKGRPAEERSFAPLPSLPSSPQGEFVLLDGEFHYKISAYHQMAPFLTTIPSATDLWMFVTSGGGLTAGRVDADGSLFPYQTVDQLHDAHHHSGPLTMIRIDDGTESGILWRPFAPIDDDTTKIERNLYKNVTGHRLVFEEVHHDLGLAFRYCWSACDEFGWIRTSTLENRTATSVVATVLDGLRNVLPFGAPLQLYQQSSNLVDAYKKTEVDTESGLGIFSLTAGITDRAEAIEMLKANTVWCCGLDEFRVHLSTAAISAFREGRVMPEQSLQNGARGNYLVSTRIDLENAEYAQWHLAADSGRTQGQIVDLRRRIQSDVDLESRVTTNLRRTGEILLRDVASADGLQIAGRMESSAHHFANVLYNNMRGGVFAENYNIPVNDLRDFLQTRNPAVARIHERVLDSLSNPVTTRDLCERAQATGDADFERLCLEYLPLHFGRRHGDPSRPWNHFAIKVHNDAGERALNYEGNWRDIFQNWEALCSAFPGFLPNIVAKFVNASTVDGFNPYRINREGMDWETVEEDNPWSNIGYWGDHQIIYLLKLLEAWDAHDPAAIAGKLGAAVFSYAEVPYRIKPYADLLRNPAATIDFESERDAGIQDRVTQLGTDGKLLTHPDGSVVHVNLLEKLLVPALSKLSNLIPDAGIWMNTQRPEWNDANNALAGGGVSVVTMCHLRRYLKFLDGLLSRSSESEMSISAEVATWFTEIAAILENEKHVLVGKSMTGTDRKRLLDALGEAFSSYRGTVYVLGFTGQSQIQVEQVRQLCTTALDYLDWGIEANRRDDGLYHTYNLLEIDIEAGQIDVVRLQEMLEGQVAVLSSGILDPGSSLAVLDRLFESELHVPEQRSFVLYPERELPSFLEKNSVPSEAVEAIPLLRDLLLSRDRSIVTRDVEGVHRFDSDFGNVCRLELALDELATQERWSTAVAQDRAAVLELFESVFNHHAYTGRSGAMYGYEGLGCIYWHMVAKLLLAVQETGERAANEGVDSATADELARKYFQIRSGIGYEKTVVEYGAFPTDPYSHTPSGGGAKQPGMTGQVKEEILTRNGELGVKISEGRIGFQPSLLRSSEFLSRPGVFDYCNVDGEPRSVTLSRGNLGFTLCQVPVIYELNGAETWHRIEFTDGSVEVGAGHRLDREHSEEVFSRGGRIRMIRIGVPTSTLSNV